MQWCLEWHLTLTYAYFLFYLFYLFIYFSQDDNLMDVLQLLVALMSEHPGSMVQAFDQRNGIRWELLLPLKTRHYILQPTSLLKAINKPVKRNSDKWIWINHCGIMRGHNTSFIAETSESCIIKPIKTLS